MHIKIRVLLIPGITTPIDIKNPDNIRYGIEIVLLKLIFSLFSITTKTQPIINEVKAKNKYLALKKCSEFTFFIKTGIEPKIKPIKAKLVCVGKVLKSNFRMFPTKKTPIMPPSIKGSK